MIYSARPQQSRSTDMPPPVDIRRSFDRDNCGLPPTKVTSTLFPTDPSDAQQHDLELAQRILQRIEHQIPGRIRHLTVYTTENAVVLAGESSTFYSKQLAQHAAMGVIEYEQLINNIEVRVAK